MSKAETTAVTSEASVESVVPEQSANAALGVYDIDGMEWWIATSCEDAQKQSMDFFGLSDEEVADADGPVSDQFLKSFRYQPDGCETISGLEQVQNLKRDGLWKRGQFAFAEY